MTRKKAAAAADANDRGEVTLPLDGRDYKLRPSHTAIVAIEEKTGRSLAQLADGAQRHALSIETMALIAAELMRAYGAAYPEDPLATDYKGAKPERLKEMIFEAGAMRVAPRLAIVLLAALTGGVTAQGEMKAVATKTAEVPATAA